MKKGDHLRRTFWSPCSRLNKSGIKNKFPTLPLLRFARAVNGHGGGY